MFGARLFGELKRLPRRVAGELALADVCNVTAVATELHDSFSLSCQNGPTRLGFRVLFNAQFLGADVASLFPTKLSFMKHTPQERIPTQ